MEGAAPHAMEQLSFPVEAAPAPRIAIPEVPAFGLEEPRDSLCRGTLAIEGSTATPDGSLLLRWCRDTKQSHTRVSVTGGLWTARRRKQRDFVVIREVLVDEQAMELVEPRGPIPLDELDGCKVVCRWPAKASLSVLSSATGEHLDAVRILEPESEFGSYPMPDSREPALLSGVRSPILNRVLGPTVVGQGEAVMTRQDVLVGREGYAWARTTIDPDRSNLVELDPAGSLEVLMHGLTPAHQSAHFSLRRRGGGLTLPLSVAEASGVVFDCLPPGDYLVTVRDPRTKGGAEVVGGTEVVVEVGRQALAHLMLAPRPPGPPRVRVRGQVVVPAEWGVDSFSLHLSEASWDRSMRTRTLQSRDLSQVYIHSRLRAWDFGFVPPGHYVLEVVAEFPEDSIPEASLDVGNKTSQEVRSSEFFAFPDPLHEERFAVPEDGMEELSIRVPPPGSVRVHIVTPSGQPFEEPMRDGLDSVLWRQSGDSLSSWQSIKRGPDGSFSFRAPQGELALRRLGRGSLTVQNGPGLDELTWALEPIHELRILFERRGVTLPMDNASEVLGEMELKAVGHEGRVTGTWSSKNGFSVSQPGLYRLDFSKLQGFADRPPVDVHVGPGRTTYVIEDN